MEKKLPLVIIALIFIGYMVLSAWSDYTWENRYLSSRGTDWILYKKFAKVADPIHFYSFIKSPTTRIGMFDKTITRHLGNGIYYARILWADKELGGGVTEEDFKYLIDCNKNMEGWKSNKSGSKSVEPNEVNDSTIIWSSFYDNNEQYPEAGALKEAECLFLETNIK